MCSIVASFSKDMIVELAKLNAVRGQHSHSISYYDCKNKTFEVHRALGPLNFDKIEIPECHYCIIHQQAPTCESRGIETVHPASVGQSLLWHNGILKPETIKELQEIDGFTKLKETWDTKLLLNRFAFAVSHQNDFSFLSEIDGSFACVLFEDFTKKLYLFRNSLAPLFIDEHYTISSMPFEKAEALAPNVVFDFYPGKLLSSVERFKTKNSPYYFEENDVQV